MADDSKRSTGSRRRYIKALGAGVALTLAGCTDGEGGDGDTETTTTTEDGGGGNGGTMTGTTQEEVENVVIGANHPLTGFLAQSGQGMTNAGELAVQHVNEGGVVPGFDDGGIPALGGAELEFVSRDNEASQELGGEVTQQLIEEDGADVLTGCFSSPVTLSATQVSERDGIPHVIDVSVADRILQGRGLNYTYRIQTPASGMAGNYAEFMPELARSNDVTMDTASLVYLDNAFGQSIRDTLREDLPEQDVELVREVAYSFGQESMDTPATRIQQEDADAFIFVGYGAGGTRMMESLQNVDYRPKLLTGTSTPTFTDDDVVAGIGKYANGGFGNNYEFDYTLDWTDQIFADYRVEYGKPLGITHAVMTYSAVITIANAVEEAGSSEPDAINDALQSITVEDHPAAMSPIEFNDIGENSNALSPMLQVQNLDPTLVWPEQYQQTEPQF